MIRPLRTAHAGESLGVLRLGLAAPGVGDTGETHQLALVTTVGEDGGAKLHSIARSNGEDAAIFLPDAAMFGDWAVEEESDVRLAQHGVEDFSRDVGFEEPLDRLAVVCANTGEELARDAADDRGIAFVGGAESAGDEAADVMAGLYDCDADAFSRCGDSRGNAAGGTRHRRRGRIALAMSQRLMG